METSPNPNSTKQPSPRPITRSQLENPCPTTFVQADPATFKQIVQMLTGSPAKPDPNPLPLPPPAPQQQQHKTQVTAPALRTVVAPKKPQSGPGFRLYERRNPIKKLTLIPLIPLWQQPGHGVSPRNPPPPEAVSPSVLDFTSLLLSPVTTLIADPFTRSPPSPALDMEAEERAIKEKGFYLHPSPATTPRPGGEPKLLPLFPLTSPTVSASTASD